MDITDKLVSALYWDRVVRQPGTGPSCFLKDFCIHYPKSFDGTSDHISAEN